MEFKVSEYVRPEHISFNYEELKAELTEKVSYYATLVYTEDQIKEAKTDRASLNKLKKALNDERIRREKEYLEPFNEFKKQVNEIIRIIDEPLAVIDNQIKEYEQQKKEEKKDEIVALFNEAIEKNPHLSFVTFDKIYKDKWFNLSTSIKSVSADIAAALVEAEKNLNMLEELPEFSFEAVEIYKQSLDVTKAVTEAKRMSEIQKAKAEAEAKKKEDRIFEPVPEEIPQEPIAPNPGEDCHDQRAPGEWISFSAYLTAEDAAALKQFFDARKIKFKAI